MQIHELKLKNRKKPKKIIGRGGSRGTYSGRGIKGQKSRSGASINPLFEGGRSTLIDHLKKNRGFKSSHLSKYEVGISSIEKHFSDGDTVNLIALQKKGLVTKNLFRRKVKIINDGLNKIGKKITLDKKIACSESCKKMVEKAKN